LACEDMLSDPDILPHLTKAMRDIAWCIHSMELNESINHLYLPQQYTLRHSQTYLTWLLVNFIPMASMKWQSYHWSSTRATVPLIDRTGITDPLLLQPSYRYIQLDLPTPAHLRYTCKYSHLT
jgi:hypothetical protein